MKPEQIFEKYRQTARYWADSLQQYSAEEFAKQPAADSWSLAQVCHHMVLTTAKCLANARLCADGKGEERKIAIGPAIFSLMGSFPPVKLRIKNIPGAVTDIYHPQNISRQEAAKQLQESILAMQEAMQWIATANPRRRVEHWASGWFNALQWYHSAEMHLRHHLRQKRRIDKVLGK